MTATDEERQLPVSIDRRLRILLVEDDGDDAKIFEGILRKVRGLSLHLDCSTTFDTGLAKVRTGRYDLHFIDHRLGAETGLDLVQRALREDPSKAFVLLTGWGDERLAAEAIRRGAADYLPKGDLSPSSLVRCFSTCLADTAARTDELQRACRASFDDLMGVYSDELFQRVSRNRLNANLGAGSHWALLFVDVDNFDNILEHWGASVADHTLRMVAKAIRASLVDTEPVGRCGGDEFCVLITCSGREEAEELAEQVRADIESGTEATVSIGVAVEPAHSARIETLIGNAGIAMHEAIELGRNRVELWGRR